MVAGILRLFQRDNAFSWRNIFQIVKTSSFQRMPWSLEQITTCTNETGFEMVLESASRRLHVFYAILYVLKVFFNILLHSFQTKIALLQRECTKSGRTLLMECHILQKNATWIHRCWVIVCKTMLNPYPECTLSALFCFNCCGIFWKNAKPFRKLDLKKYTLWTSDFIPIWGKEGRN